MGTKLRIDRYMNRELVYARSLTGLDSDLPAIEAGICKDATKCLHPYLNKWDGVYVCMDCWKRLNAYDVGTKTCTPMEGFAERIAMEEELEKNTSVDDMPEELSEEEKRDLTGRNSSARGVKIGFLMEFTKKNRCWEWSSWDVIRKIIKPLTARSRCRFVDLPAMQGHTGQASTFISYAQAGTWGDLLAAILDGGADLERCVWLDLFAVRQWPSSRPDLDFASTIAYCSSFMVVCSSLKEVEDMDVSQVLSGRIEGLPGAVRKKICFMRVWCLVEAQQACKMGMPYIMKCGSYALDANGDVHFEHNDKMLSNMMYLVNIEKAEATVTSDKEHILKSIDEGVGKEALNCTIRGSIMGGFQLAKSEKGSLVGCAACGDQEAITLLMEDPSTICNVAGGGFIDLLRRLVHETDADVHAAVYNGLTAVMHACLGGHLECVKYLVGEAGADVHAADKDG